MTSNPDPTVARRQGIAQLVQRGELKHQNPGFYLEPDATARVPDYEHLKVQEVFPDILQINFDEDVDEKGVSHGFWAVLLDGRGPDQKVSLGKTPPPDTEGLINVIRAYYSEQYNVAALEQGRAVFDGLDDDE